MRLHPIIESTSCTGPRSIHAASVLTLNPWVKILFSIQAVMLIRLVPSGANIQVVRPERGAL